jgi:hypothetical protein
MNVDADTAQSARCGKPHNTEALVLSQLARLAAGMAAAVVPVRDV